MMWHNDFRLKIKNKGEKVRDIIKYFLLFGWLWNWQEFKYFERPLKVLAIAVNLIAAAFAVALIVFLLTNPFSLNQVSPVTTVTVPAVDTDLATFSRIDEKTIYLNGHYYVCIDCNTAPVTTVPTTAAVPTILPTATVTPVVLDGLFPETKIINGSSEGKKTVLIIAVPNKGQFTLPIYCGDNSAKVKSLMAYLTKYGPSIVDGKITFTLDIYQNTIISIIYRWQRPDGISEYDTWSCGEKISS